MQVTANDRLHQVTGNDRLQNVTLENGELFYNPNGTDIKLSSRDVNTLDGIQAKYIAINGEFPGPTLEVPLGATVYVHVHNQLMTDSATIHWHGLTHRGSGITGGKGTPWSDGAPYITQCPIPPGNSFTYRFVADEAGTFWYHSHLSMQRMDGLFGALIVTDNRRPSYPSFNVLVNDWLHMDSDEFATSLYGPGEDTATYSPIPDRYDDLADEDVGDLASDSFLINGRGRFNNTAPLTIHRVDQGQQYMFRFINTGFDNMVEVSIDGHRMTVVGVDSCEVEPVVLDSVFLAIGERVNVLITADQPEDNYWVRYRAPHKSQTPLAHSILSYTSSSADPNTAAKQCTESNKCVALNCPFQTAPGWKCIPMHMMKSTSYHAVEVEKISDGSDISEHFLAYSYMAGDSINGRTLELPSSPFYQQHYSKTGTVCDDTVCDSVGCACTHVRKLPTNKVVQIVVMHHVLKFFIHTWHMHGYRFAVLKVAYPPKDNSTGLIMSTYNREINCSNDFCNDAHWANDNIGQFDVDRPPLKDTVMIPNGGYAVVRIYTDNPGYWMAHCHQTEHLHEGMAMVFDVDGESVKDTIPPNFPTCGDFTLSPTK
ncbi:hypothetical protein EB796_008520 [Bugula neritina]|uniref:Uncharacterized protein n=1 Tax=Bugula neritina TaxID=10212 RepID=A0A7J7K5G5_BUGNE|nr:hypothetical protein EB796_008520 [Bugula neritina]